MSEATKHVMEPLVNSTGWMTFIGVMCILTGSFYCMTIVGAVVGWLPLWMGIVLCQASDVSTIVGLVFVGLYFVVMLVIFSTGVWQ